MKPVLIWCQYLYASFCQDGSIMRLTIILLMVLGLIPHGFSQTYIPLDNESTIEFKIKNFGSTVDGKFSGLKGAIVFDSENESTTRFDVTVDANTIDTNIGMRDNHLRKKEYFSVKEYPTIRFLSTKMDLYGSGNGTLTGKLTIKKTTREIIIPFTYSINKDRLTLHGEFPLNRLDFEVGGNSFSLSDELKVLIRVTAKEQPSRN